MEMQIPKLALMRRVVLFLDILGFRDLIRQGREDVLFEALQFPIALRGHYPFDGKTEMEITAFSDSIVVSELMESNFNAVRMVNYAGYLQMKLMSQGVLTRGGIAIGPMHHKDGIAFGKGFIDAYEIEQGISVFPRIAVSDEVLIATVESHLEVRKQFALAFMDDLRVDFDGVVHVNPFHLSSGLSEKYLPLKQPEKPGEGISISQEEVDSALEHLIADLMKERPQKNPRVAAKYDWLERFHENHHLGGSEQVLKAYCVAKA